MNRQIWDRDHKSFREASDQEEKALAAQDREKEVQDKARLKTELGQLEARRAQAMGLALHNMGEWDRVEADARIRCNVATGAMDAANAPFEEAQRVASAARRALPFAPTHAEQAAVQALEDKATLLQREIDPRLLAEVQAASRALDHIQEDRRRGGVTPPRPAAARYVWTEDDRNLLAHLVSVDADAPGDIYGPRYGIGLPSGSAVPSWRGLYGLAGLSTRDRRFTDDAWVNQEDLGGWLCEDNSFQRKLANALRAGLASRFQLDPAKGAEIRRRDQDHFGARPWLVGVTT